MVRRKNGAQRSGYTGDEAKPYGYVGQLGHQTDSECGLIYMRARYYDPMLGRFISEDPGQNGGNWYTYCNGNPVNLVDPDGRASLYEELVRFLGAPLAMDLIGLLTLEVGCKLDNGIVIAIGLIISVIGVIWTVRSFGSLMEKVGRPWVREQLRQLDGDTRMYEEIKLIKQSAVFAFAGSLVELEYYTEMALL